MYGGHEDAGCSRSSRNVNIPDAGPEGILGLGKIPGSLNIFLEGKKRRFPKMVQYMGRSSLATEVRSLFDRLRTQVSIEFEAMVEGMKKMHSALSLNKQVAEHSVEKWKLTQQTMNLTIEYCNNEIAQVRNSSESEYQELKEVIKATKESIETSDKCFDILLKTSNNDKV